MSDPGALRVGEVMQPGILTCRPGTPLPEVARMMVEHRTAHLLVTGRGTGIPVGVLSTLDLAAALGGPHRAADYDQPRRRAPKLRSAGCSTPP